LGEEGLKMIRSAADENGLKVVTEILDLTLVDLVGKIYRYFSSGGAQYVQLSVVERIGEIAETGFVKAGFCGNN
jgi:hypothetical protein